MNKQYYVTTAIPYVNGRPHIGHALEFVQTDVLARYHRQKGEDVFFLTGTDDNSLKNVQAAEKEKLETAVFVDRGADVFEDLAEKLSISNDYFVRTARDAHFKGAQKLWLACKPEDIYKKSYKGLYCVGCEQFYNEDELDEGKCPEHKKELEKVEEENFFFKLSNYQNELEKLIESDTYKVIPESRKNEVLSFIRQGLEDFSISRSVERAKGWGVPVHGDDTQIMYVWFDALSNYLTGLGYGNDEKLYEKFWTKNEERIHVVGKGIIRFHAVYWPAMLLSAGIPLPKELFVHGYINSGGTKMSKSLGNVVDPLDMVERFGSEATRFFLLKHIHPFQDSDYTEARFKEAYNADLANGLGNLLSRVTNMAEKYFDGKIAVNSKQKTDLPKRIDKYINEYNYREALQEIWKDITHANQVIDQEKPWELAKTDMKKLESLLVSLITSIKYIADALEPFLPETAKIVSDAVTSEKIVKTKPLFGKIEI